MMVLLTPDYKKITGLVMILLVPAVLTTRSIIHEDSESIMSWSQYWVILVFSFLSELLILHKVDRLNYSCFFFYKNPFLVFRQDYDISQILVSLLAAASLQCIIQWVSDSLEQCRAQCGQCLLRPQHHHLSHLQQHHLLPPQLCLTVQ